MVVAFFGLLIALPPMLVIALFVAAGSRGPILFRQRRNGRNGKPFQILKFRTMYNENAGPALTRAGDQRITPVGRYLRCLKLDELPQLINVLRGEMSMVGPRPDLPEIWNQASATERQIVALRPGLTGAASLAFHEEERILAQAPAGRLTDFYLKS